MYVAGFTAKHVPKWYKYRMVVTFWHIFVARE